MFISDNYKLVFLEVPRTGSRSITKALTDLDPGSPTVQLRNKTGALDHYHSFHVPERVDDSYAIVAAHRNPYDRLWSHWKFRHQWGNPEIFKSISWPRYVSWACNPDSVPEISGALLELPITEMLDCGLVTHWLDFEQLATSWRQLVQDTGLPLPELDWINRSVAMEASREAYDRETASMVAQRYAADFIRFKYDTELWH